jgi:peptidyl-prolyl cis-trans isomerase A (cyclophilin A)
MNFVRMTTGLGEVLIELRPDRAPRSVAAFLAEVDAGSYDGGAFWRLVRADNDQGAPPIEIVQGRCIASIEPRIDLVYEATGVPHEDGTISLPQDAAGLACAQQFFICIGAQPALDEGGGRDAEGRGFPAFGRVIAGMDVVRAIHAARTAETAPSEFFSGQIAAEPVAIHRIERLSDATAVVHRPSDAAACPSSPARP